MSLMGKKVDESPVQDGRPERLKNVRQFCPECKREMHFFDFIDRKTTVWSCQNKKCPKYRVFIF